MAHLSLFGKFANMKDWNDEVIEAIELIVILFQPSMIWFLPGHNFKAPPYYFSWFVFKLQCFLEDLFAMDVAFINMKYQAPRRQLHNCKIARLQGPFGSTIPELPGPSSSESSWFSVCTYSWQLKGTVCHKYSGNLRFEHAPRFRWAHQAHDCGYLLSNLFDGFKCWITYTWTKVPFFGRISRYPCQTKARSTGADLCLWSCKFL